jgi:hypothetical protein
VAESRPFERGERVGFQDAPGWVVLLDADMKEVVDRQECSFTWELTPGGANHSVTTRHEFDIQGKSVTYMGVGGGDKLLFVSIVAGHPVEHGSFMHV